MCRFVRRFPRARGPPRGRPLATVVRRAALAALQPPPPSSYLYVVRGRGRPILTEVVPESTHSTKFDHMWPTSCDVEPTSASSAIGRPGVNQVLANLGRTWTSIMRCSGSVGRTRPELARDRPDVGRLRLHSDRARLTRAPAKTGPPEAERAWPWNVYPGWRQLSLEVGDAGGHETCCFFLMFLLAPTWPP